MLRSDSRHRLLRQVAPNLWVSSPVGAGNFCEQRSFFSRRAMDCLGIAARPHLWRSRREGSERQQLTSSPHEASLPQWSPDGKQIAYMGRQTGQLWNLFNPCWSPKGRYLAATDPSQNSLMLFDFQNPEMIGLAAGRRSTPSYPVWWKSK